MQRKYHQNNFMCVGSGVDNIEDWATENTAHKGSLAPARNGKCQNENRIEIYFVKHETWCARTRALARIKFNYAMKRKEEKNPHSRWVYILWLYL